MNLKEVDEKLGDILFYFLEFGDDYPNIFGFLYLTFCVCVVASLIFSFL